MDRIPAEPHPYPLTFAEVRANSVPNADSFEARFDLARQMTEVIWFDEDGRVTLGGWYDPRSGDLVGVLPDSQLRLGQ